MISFKQYYAKSLGFKPLSRYFRILEYGKAGLFWVLQVLETYSKSLTKKAHVKSNKLYKFPAGYSSSSSRESMASISVSTLIGLGICPFMPLRMASCLSSSKALAVMARMGMRESFLFFSLRISRVAS